jgi:hypothetical protein
LDWLLVIKKIDWLKNKTIMGCCNAFMANYPVSVRVRNATNWVIQFPVLTSARACGKKKMVITQAAMMDGEEGTTKYAEGAKFVNDLSHRPLRSRRRERRVSVFL